MTTKNKKNIEIDKRLILRDLDQLLNIQHYELKVWWLANNLRKNSKILYVWIRLKRKYISNLKFSIAVQKR